ncbi:MAG TPA: hypothetical protein VGR31_04420 [Planctomycetota bacterium]|jgi:photosystem II stability/assembly factor-like uncharacterized protein|nr:hypothetical protein [Planctomycetota bacterium]
MLSFSSNVRARFFFSCRTALVALALFLCSPTHVAHAQSTPFEYVWGGLVEDAFTFNGTEVWTVEDGGRIRHRSVANGAWTFQDVPTQVNKALRRIHFVPESPQNDGPTGWAVGDFGWVIKTTNGGTSWSVLGSQMPAVLDAQHLPKYAPPFEQLYDVHFLDEQRGWLCGLHGIWRTTNGGTTWTACTLLMQDNHPISGTSDQNLLQETELYALDVVERPSEAGTELVGMASAEPGLVFKTTDGVTWKVVLDVRCLCKLSTQNCNNFPLCTSCYDCTSLPAIDGCLAAPTAPGDPQGLACELSICDADSTPFEMWDVEISRHPTLKLAVATGGVGTGCGMIFTSIDDGVHWTKEAHECQSVKDCSLAADPTYLYNDVPPTIPPNTTHLYRHKEYFTVYNAAILSGDNTVIGTAYSGGVHVRNPATGVWEDRSQFNTRIHDVPTAVTMPLNGIAAQAGSGTAAVLVGFGGTIRETANAGQSWADAITTEHCAEFRIYDLEFTTSADGFQAGQFARIGRTANSGAHWDTVADPVTGTLRSIIFAGTAKGVAVGDLFTASTGTGPKPTILRTINTGALWTAPSSLSFANPGGLLDVCSAGVSGSEAIYWSVGQKDFILKSTDSGQNWAQILRNGGQDVAVTLDGVAFKDSLQGILVGSDGASHALAWQYHRNGIQTWANISPSFSGCEASMLSDVVISGNTAFAVGERTCAGVRTGIVLRSDLSGGEFQPFAVVAGMPTFPLAMTNDPFDLADIPVLIEAEVDGGDLWVGGQCGRVWKCTSSGAWTEFQKTQTDTHIQGISGLAGGSGTYRYFGGYKHTQPAHCMVRYHQP